MKQHVPERRRVKRRRFAYYMQILNDDTLELVGHLSDISPTGFKLDTALTLPAGHEIALRMELTSDIADRPYIVFIARSKWCATDPLTPNMNNIGFELAEILPDDRVILDRIQQRYGA